MSSKRNTTSLDIDSDSDEEVQFISMSSREPLSNPPKKQRTETSLQATIASQLELLLDNYLRTNFDTLPSDPVKHLWRRFFKPTLQQYYHTTMPIITQDFKEQREQLVQEKCRQLHKAKKMEATQQSEVEFLSDPALLLYIFSYLSLDEVFKLRQSCRFFQQFIQTNFSFIATQLPLIWSYSIVLQTSLTKFDGLITERKDYKKLCVLKQEQGLLEVIAAKAVKIGQCFDETTFKEWFQTTFRSFSPFVWYKVLHTTTEVESNKVRMQRIMKASFSSLSKTRLYCPSYLLRKRLQ